MRDGAEATVHQDDIAGFAGDVGAVPHGEADIARLESQCIVHSVTGHADDKACLLHGMNDLLFMFGSHSREDAHGVQPLQEGRRRSIELMQFFPGDDGIAKGHVVLDDAHHLRNMIRG